MSIFYKENERIYFLLQTPKKLAKETEEKEKNAAAASAEKVFDVFQKAKILVRINEQYSKVLRNTLES